jgi:predicted ester cyclase
MIQRLIMLRTAFPDMQYTVEDEIVEGDKVVHRLIGHGTQQGEFLGIPPTGKQATWTGIAIYRIAGGKIAERWVNVDNLGTIQQLGAILSLG